MGERVDIVYIRRDVEDYIRSAASSFQAIVIYGPRQVGKSTTVDMIFGDKFKSVTLDDTNERELALSNPKGFLEVHSWPIIIDEVQKAPNLLSEIKIIIDEQRKKWLKEDKKRELMFVLTGSNQFELQNGISESLAGRAAVFNMFSMTQLESQKINGNFFYSNKSL